jgi:hypothetical protein
MEDRVSANADSYGLLIVDHVSTEPFGIDESLPEAFQATGSETAGWDVKIAIRQQLLDGGSMMPVVLISDCSLDMIEEREDECLNAHVLFVRGAVRRCIGS